MFTRQGGIESTWAPMMRIDFSTRFDGLVVVDGRYVDFEIIN